MKVAFGIIVKKLKTLPIVIVKTHNSAMKRKKKRFLLQCGWHESKV